MSSDRSILERDPLNAFCRHTHAAVEGSPRGPLAGLSFGLKDLFDVAGTRTGFGSPDWLRTHDPAPAHAPVLQRLLDAGASMVGRTHTEEMAFSLTGENAHYGTPVNPAAPDRVPGGSSSGSASAVAGGLVDFAVGTDTGGSVRAPASYCGILGIRPTHGRIPLAGACPLAPSFDTVGWFAREADTLARVGDVLLDPPGDRTDLPDRPARLLLARDAMALTTPAVAAALAPAIAHVERAFGPAEPVDVSPEGLHAWFEVFRVLQFHEIWRTHRHWVTRVRPAFGPQIRRRFDAVAQVTDAEAAAMVPKRRVIADHLGALLRDQAVLVLPTMPDVAPLRGTPPEAVTAARERAIQLLCIAGLGGLPQLSLPMATVGGCPVGLSLVAARGHDELLLAMAGRILPSPGSAHGATASPP